MQKVNETPTAKIAIKKNVVKNYEVDFKKTVFLKDGTEFEIELFNPTKENILAELVINGKPIYKNGLILRPGERVFLERYLDENKKFKFSTYNVEDSQEAKEAISNNGQVKVYFFTEKGYENYTYISYPEFKYSSYSAYTSYTYSPSSNNEYKSITLDNTGKTNLPTAPNTVKTGIVEKGSNSNQSFSTSTMKFEKEPFHIEEIKILPEDYKINASEDLKYKKYCSNCGKKVNNKDNYCSYCGNKL